MHRRTKKVLIVFGVVIVALGALYGIMLARSKAKLRAVRTALAQDGRPMDAAELIPPEIPESQNAASLYLEAAEPLKGEPGSRGRSPLEKMGRLAYSVTGDTVDANDLAELKERMAQADVISAMATFEKALQRPKCRFDSAYEMGGDRDRSIPYEMRILGRLRGVQAVFEAQAGRTDRAWEMVLTQFNLADALRREPTLSGQCQHAGIVGELCRVIEKLYEISPPSDADYQKIDALLTEHLDIGFFVYAADAERLFRGEYLFSLPRDELYEEFKRQGMFGYSEQTSGALSRLGFRVIAFRPRLVADHAAYLEMMRNGVKVLEGPFAPLKGTIDMEHRDLSGKGLLCRELAPFIALDKMIHCRVVTGVSMTRAAMGLLRYRQAHGTFPESLDALGLKGLIDPYVDAPLHYRSGGDSCIVYSVGEDQKDNGGKPEPPRDTSGRRQKKPIEFDLIWQFPKAEKPTA